MNEYNTLPVYYFWHQRALYHLHILFLCVKLCSYCEFVCYFSVHTQNETKGISFTKSNENFQIGMKIFLNVKGEKKRPRVCACAVQKSSCGSHLSVILEYAKIIKKKNCSTKKS